MISNFTVKHSSLNIRNELFCYLGKSISLKNRVDGMIAVIFHPKYLRWTLLSIEFDYSIIEKGILKAVL